MKMSFDINTTVKIKLILLMVQDRENTNIVKNYSTFTDSTIFYLISTLLYFTVINIEKIPLNPLNYFAVSLITTNLQLGKI